MGLLTNLDNTRRLVDRLQARGHDLGDAQLTNDLAALAREIEALENAGRQLEAENARLQQTGPGRRAGPEGMEQGCYRFPGDDALYCPTCWDSRDRKTATRRLSARRRVCPVCTVSITS